MQMSDKSSPQLSPAWKAAKPFVNGGLSGMAATCIIQPIDMVKVRIQIGAKGGPVRSVPCCISKQDLALISLVNKECCVLLRAASYVRIIFPTSYVRIIFPMVM